MIDIFTEENPCTEIGKLENGEADPCYDCQHCIEEYCLQCDDYNKYEPPIDQ